MAHISRYMSRYPCSKSQVPWLMLYKPHIKPCVPVSVYLFLCAYSLAPGILPLFPRSVALRLFLSNLFSALGCGNWWITAIKVLLLRFYLMVVVWLSFTKHPLITRKGLCRKAYGIKALSPLCTSWIKNSERNLKNTIQRKSLGRKS